MKYMTSTEIRNIWLSFFEKKGHKIEPSAPLIPVDDNTLLWINAGVAPLKKYFDGREAPSNKRIVNAQKCIRTNDIDNVGKTARHHTFFEMLGNFSIGDYFKREALEFAYELLFSDDYFGFPLDKIYITYYPDDLDALKYWKDLGIEDSHLIQKSDNFWEIGDGPCGPDTEVHFDRGEGYDIRGPELIRDDVENERYIEIWNIVFSQFNAKTGLDRSLYPELPNKNIDTGAGLERIACILQGTKTNFETDLFMPILKKIEELTNIKYDGQMAFKVIADHTKALTFSISDGAVLSNEGRGYVLRRLLRRAVKYGYKLGLKDPFIHKLVDTVIDIMKGFYPYLADSSDIVKDIIRKEEMKFYQTIESGERQIESLLQSGIRQIDGKSAFKLFDTYGFPIELTLEYAEEASISVDLDGFFVELTNQKIRSRNARNEESSMGGQNEEYLSYTELSEFIGYDSLESKSKVIKVFDEGIILDVTPFYAFSGGQIADKGTLNGYECVDVIKLPNGQHLHVVDYRFNAGDIVEAKVDKEFRESVERNHSATHLLQKALREVLGNHVNQQGSLVTDKSLRFDFNNYNQVTDEEILVIEDKVNNRILEHLPVRISMMSIEEAIKKKATALFSEKYGNYVRVVDMGYSMELCGGTHVKNTKDIMDFAIASIESIGSGIYRIEGITGPDLSLKINDYLPLQLEEVETAFQKNNISREILSRPKLIGSYSDIVFIREYIQDLKLKNKENLAKAKEENLQKVLSNINDYLPEKISKRMVIETNELDIPVLKELTDAIFDKTKAELLLVINKESDKISFIVKSSFNNASDIVKKLASVSSGSGGGKGNLAQGGTKDLDKYPDILKAFGEYL